MSETKVRKKWFLNSAAWAPTNRMVAYSASESVKADQPSVAVIETFPGDVVLTREEAERISCVIRGLECEQSGGCDPCSNNKELINELWKFGETIQSEINQQTKEAT